MLLAVIDVQHKLLPDRVTLPVDRHRRGAAGRGRARHGRLAGAAGRARGAVVLFVVFLVLALISPRSIGMGDVKLAALLGLYLGWLGGARCWCSAPRRASSSRRVLALVLLATRRIGLRGELPFGPAMLLGAALAIGWSGASSAELHSRLHSVISGAPGHPMGGPVSAVRVNNAQVAARFGSTSSSQPRGRVSRSGPDGRHPQGAPHAQALRHASSASSPSPRTASREEKGATAVEYGLLVGLIAVAIIVTVDRSSAAS